MSKSHIPFGYFTPHHACPWRLANSGGTLFYTGPEVDHVDYSSAIAGIAADNDTVFLPLSLERNCSVVLAARRVAASGLIESNTHVLAKISVDSAGRLIHSLPTIFDLTLTASKVTTLVEFSCSPDSSQVQPTLFEIFTDNGCGVLNVDAPAATISGVSGQRDYRLTLPLLPPILIGMRPRYHEQAGPLVTARLAIAAPPPSPALFVS